MKTFWHLHRLPALMPLPLQDNQLSGVETAIKKELKKANRVKLLLLKLP